jgi:hypothetical protein
MGISGVKGIVSLVLLLCCALMLHAEMCGTKPPEDGAECGEKSSDEEPLPDWGEADLSTDPKPSLIDLTVPIEAGQLPVWAEPQGLTSKFKVDQLRSHGIFKIIFMHVMLHAVACVRSWSWFQQSRHVRLGLASYRRAVQPLLECEFRHTEPPSLLTGALPWGRTWARTLLPLLTTSLEQ